MKQNFLLLLFVVVVGGGGFFYFLLFFFFIGVELIYSVALPSALQHSESVIDIHISTLLVLLFFSPNFFFLKNFTLIKMLQE